MLTERATRLLRHRRLRAGARRADRRRGEHAARRHVAAAAVTRAVLRRSRGLHPPHRHPVRRPGQLPMDVTGAQPAGRPPADPVDRPPDPRVSTTSGSTRASCGPSTPATPTTTSTTIATSATTRWWFPAFERRWMQVTTFTYLCDVDETNGATAAVPKRFSAEHPARPAPHRARRAARPRGAGLRQGRNHARLFDRSLPPGYVDDIADGVALHGAGRLQGRRRQLDQQARVRPPRSATGDDRVRHQRRSRHTYFARHPRARPPVLDRADHRRHGGPLSRHRHGARTELAR